MSGTAPEQPGEPAPSTPAGGAGAAHVHGPECGCGHDHGPAVRRIAGAAKVGRNDPCPCGSGKKYKKCCGR